MDKPNPDVERLLGDYVGAESGSRYILVNRRLRPDSDPHLDPDPPPETVENWDTDAAYDEFDLQPTVETAFVLPADATSSAAQTTSDAVDRGWEIIAASMPVIDPSVKTARRSDPCMCGSCREAYDKQVFYVTTEALIVLKPLAIDSVYAEVAGAPPMRYCPYKGTVIDQDAPYIVPWTTDPGPGPAVCCAPLRMVYQSERLELPGFGRYAEVAGSGGILLMERCPWCYESIAESIKSLSGNRK
jgi:hypothetical protein